MAPARCSRRARRAGVPGEFDPRRRQRVGGGRRPCTAAPSDRPDRTGDRSAARPTTSRSTTTASRSAISTCSCRVSGRCASLLARPGEVTCEVLDEFNECGVLADVLGDAVVWFALVPQTAERHRRAPADHRARGGLRSVRERMAYRLSAGDRARVRRHRHPELQRLPRGPCRRAACRSSTSTSSRSPLSVAPTLRRPRPRRPRRRRRWAFPRSRHRSIRRRS